jgi:hypothetical protein
MLGLLALGLSLAVDTKYRLSDCVDDNITFNRTKAKILYPDSLCVTYVEKADFAAPNAFCKHVVSYLKTHPTAPYGDSHTLVLHIRLGDVFTKSQYSTEQLLYNSNITHWSTRRYIKRINHFQHIIKNIPKNIDTVLIFGNVGHQYKPDMQFVDYLKSFHYLAYVQTLFSQHGFTVKTSILNTLEAHAADKDFLAAVTSPHLLVSGGGFGIKMYNCARYYQQKLRL